MLTLAREARGVAERRFAPVNLTGAGANRRRRARGGRRRAECRSSAWPAPRLKPEAAPSGRSRRRHCALRCARVELVDNAIRYSRPAAASTSPSITNPAMACSPSAIRDRVFGERAGARVRPLLPCARPRAAEVPGSGLGLAIVKRIAERHEATLSLEPGLTDPGGRNLTVTVRFPRKANA
jgi:two-component system OmpR family sensor kinase